MTRLLAAATGITILFSAVGATAQPANPVTSTADVSSRDQRLDIQLSGRTFGLEARAFRPSGAGPFPLVVINHGTPVSIRDAGSEKLGFTKAARWIASQGYVVVVALRPGFGASDGPYLEASGACNNRDYLRDGRETATVEGAIVQSAAALSGVDATRIIVVGQSAGGFGAIALGDTPPKGVVGIISFAGGRGGDDHENICSGAKRLIDAASVFGRSNQVPQLWLFAANDHFFAPSVAHALFEAYQAGSAPSVRFIDLPVFGDDGHKTLAKADPSVWSDPVSQFLHKLTR